MLNVLAQVSREPGFQDRLFGGNARLREMEAKLESLPDSAPVAQRVNLLSSIGDIHLAQGRPREAVARLETAIRFLSPLKGRISAEVWEHALLDVAVANLRWGEVENCVHQATCDSCLLPIRKLGVHRLQSGSRRAIVHLTRLLQFNPNHVTARWLLNIAYMTVGEYPENVPPRILIPPERFRSESMFPRFTNVAKDVGLASVSLSGGVAVDDFDDDGLLDVVTSDWSTSGQLRYFRNNGDGSFTERTKEAGFEGMYGGLNLVQADYDNDGHVDLLVLRGAWLGQAGRVPNSLLKNDGKGRFRDVTFESGLGAVNSPTQTAAWADFDNDGDLDLFVGNENDPCQLFRNDGRGHFTDIARESGVINGGFTKGAVWGDFNGDGFPDLYISNYGTPTRVLGANPRDAGVFSASHGERNRLYINNRDGTFTDVADRIGVGRPALSFATWAWDVNNDGALDIFVAAYSGRVDDVAADYLGRPHQAESMQLYLGDGKGRFREVSREFGLGRAALAMGANFGDLDNDGFDDFYLGTGAPEFKTLVPNLMFRNRGGRGFVDVTFAGGFGHLQKGHGVAFADLDNDGDQDVFIVLGGAYKGDFSADALFENPGFGNHWITLKLIGTRSNRSAIGARIRVEIEESGTVRSIYKWVNSGGSFGANPLRREIGLGQAERIRVLEIFWPTTGTSQRFENIASDQVLEITEGKSDFRVLSRKPFVFRRSTPLQP